MQFCERNICINITKKPAPTITHVYIHQALFLKGKMQQQCN